MHEGENVGHFIEGLKYSVQVEVWKSHADNFGECARMPLIADSAIWRAGKAARRGCSFRLPGQGPMPMRLGNVKDSQ